MQNKTLNVWRPRSSPQRRGRFCLCQHGIQRCQVDILTATQIFQQFLLVHGLTDRAGLPDYVDDILTKVGLDPSMKRRYPHQFSGGQRQLCERLCFSGRKHCLYPRYFTFAGLSIALPLYFACLGAGAFLRTSPLKIQVFTPMIP